jgi:hypothetical protein
MAQECSLTPHPSHCHNNKRTVQYNPQLTLLSANAMLISNTSLNAPASSPVGQIVSNAATPFVESAKPGTPPSTVVTLSAQGQKLSQSQTSSNSSNSSNSAARSNQSQTSYPVNSVAKQSVQSVPKEANEAPGIQFITGETRGGRISTYA